MGFGVISMQTLQMQISILSDYLNKKIEKNNFVIDDDIVKLSQFIDNYIVMHERLKQNMKSCN